MYDADLAFVHVDGFGDVAQAAARELLARLRKPSRVVDLGCGGGTLAAEVERRGHRVWGVDVSPAMVALARQNAPRSTFDVADALAVRLPPCDAIVLAGEILNYALADRTLAAADDFFTRAFTALSPGGILLFDVAAPDRQRTDYVAERQGKGWRVAAHVASQGDRLERTIDTWRSTPEGERHTREVHRQRLLAADWVEDRLTTAGFLVEALGGYDDLPFEEGWDAYGAVKPAA